LDFSSELTVGTVAGPFSISELTAWGGNGHFSHFGDDRIARWRIVFQFRIEIQTDPGSPAVPN